MAADVRVVRFVAAGSRLSWLLGSGHVLHPWAMPRDQRWAQAVVERDSSALSTFLLLFVLRTIWNATSLLVE